jgi:hypothetical protein
VRKEQVVLWVQGIGPQGSRGGELRQRSKVTDGEEGEKK